MPEPIKCPACFSLNKPDRVRCRVCGQKLQESRDPRRPTAPVVLQRVMSGEVFTAVLGDVGASATQEGPASPTEPIAVTVDEGELTARVLASCQERLERLATEKGQRFKPYAPEKPRRPAGAEAEKAVARETENAVAAFRERRFEAAVQHLLKAIAKDDADPRTWILLAESYLRIDKPFKAAVGYLRAVQLEAKDTKSWIGLARTLKAAGDEPGALEVLDCTVQVQPGHPEAWAERGLLLESLQNLSESVKSFSRALELRPEHKLAREHLDSLQSRLLAEMQAPPVAEPPPAAKDDEFAEFEDLVAPREAPEAAPQPEPATTPAPAKARGRPARVRTFVEGLDEGVGGGFPWGHVVLLEGAPGTMKSSVAFSILLRNAVHEGLHCLYVSLEERASSLLKQMESLGLPMKVEQGSLVVLDPRAAKGLLDAREDWVAAFQEGLASIQAERGLDLLVIDSLEALEVLARFKDRRREIFRLFEWLRDLGITSLVITERPDWVLGGQVVQGRWDEDFLADGVLHLRQHLVTDLEVQRRLRVVKMRGTKHESGYLALVLDEGRFKVTRAMSP